MKAVKIEKFGSPDVLKVENVEIGKPQSNEVLIKNLSIGINYIDTYHRTGLYPIPLPSGIGLEACGEIETHHPGYLGSQDTFYVGNLKGVGRIYQQTFVDTYSKVAFAKLYTTKTPITSADVLNDRVLPFFEAQELPMLRILTDRGTEYCGKVEQHDYQLYLAINDIDHTKTKARHPQTNGICERFHKTILNEFYQVTFRKKLYDSLEMLQKDLDDWLDYYNNERTHQGKMCCGRTPMETLTDGKRVWAEKNLAQI